MQIPITRFLDMKLVRGLSPYHAHKIVQRNYCPAMTRAGLCTTECDDCIPNMQEIFAEPLRGSAGFASLTLRCRYTAAKAIEQSRPVPASETNAQDPFAAALADMEHT